MRSLVRLLDYLLVVLSVRKGGLSAFGYYQKGMAQPYWLATYMQNPVALDGNIIKVENFIKFPTGAPLNATFILASADTAYSVKTTADYSVIQIWAVVLREATDSQGVVHKIPSIALLDQVRVGTNTLTY